MRKARRIERLVRAYYEAIDGGDVEAALHAFREDAVYRRPGYPPLCGLGEIRAFYVDQRVIASGRHTLLEVVPTRSSVTVVGSFCGLSRRGEALAVGFADVWKVHGGLATERHTFFAEPAV
jgi:ketosteroid isomerase-like protein